MKQADILIIGGGFCGTMLLYHLARLLPAGRKIALAQAGEAGPGVAYSTVNPSHLLNVRTGRMGALQAQPLHFYEWLQSPQGALAINASCPGYIPHPDNYAPRVLYGAYLESLYAESLEAAHRRGVQFSHLEADAVSAVREGEGFRVGFGEESIYCRILVLAIGAGNEKPLGESGNRFLQLPLAEAASCLRGLQHITIIGSGLTAVDALLTLDDMEYEGEITVLSRNALWPQAHPQNPPHPREPSANVREQKTARGMLRALRQEAQGGDWHGAIDGLRLHTQSWWQVLPAAEQRKFFARLFSFWKVHRHRMAPEVAQRLGDIFRRRRVECHAAKVQGTQGWKTDLVINCTGPSYGGMLQADAFMRSLAEAGLIVPHASGTGIKMDAQSCASEGIYALGALAVGQLLESTAVPELRVQAENLAKILAT